MTQIRTGFVLTIEKWVVQPQAVIEHLGELMKGDAIVVVGQHQMWATQYLTKMSVVKEGNIWWSRNDGIWFLQLSGASANPDKEIVLFVGDGGFK